MIVNKLICDVLIIPVWILKSHWKTKGRYFIIIFIKSSGGFEIIIYITTDKLGQEFCKQFLSASYFFCF